ncbi:MAG TPA: phosphoglycerate dehydrogenase [Candidatus Humimicrobiaceae bacterium]
MSLKELKDCNILVTPTSFAKYNRNLAADFEKIVGNVQYNNTGKPLKEDDLIPIIGKFDAMIAGLDEITSNVINNAKNLKIIARYGAGVDRVDLTAAKKSGIYVTNTPGANSVSVAELAIGLTFAAMRNIIAGNIQTKSGGWPRLSGMSLCNKIFGIIGLGSIGKEVAVRLSSFKVKILAFDIYFDKDFASRHSVEYTDLDTLLRLSDIVSLHIPVFPDTRLMINNANLQKMKKGSILINTSRGELVDEEALYDSLVSGQLKAAALDAFMQEPPLPGNKLLSLDQVIATPHIGAATDNASDEMTRISIMDCIAVLKGEKPKYPVNGPKDNI